MSSAPRPPKPVIALVVLALVAVAAWLYWSGRDASVSSSSGVSVVNGTVEAEEYRVSSVLAGRIASALATEGAPVEKGATLFVLDTALLDLQTEQAVAGYAAAQAARDQVVADGGSKAELAAADARVEQARAAVEMARAQRSYATITAPSSGVISSVAARVGENASPGRTLAIISDLTRSHVRVFVTETEIGRVKLGDAWTLESDDGTSVRGTTSFIASESEFTPNSVETKDQRAKLVYEVRITIEKDPDGVLKPGMPVTATFEGSD